MEPIYREFKFELRSDDTGDGLTMEGYAAVFNSPTRISGWEGDFDETIAPGAFRKTLRERKPVLMFNHGKHGFVGDMPIGQIVDAREDDHGVYIKARLFDNDLVRPVRDAIAGGAVSGMSFRFEPIREKWSADKRTRTLMEVRVPELGPVVMPAYEDTSVAVRTRAEDLVTALRSDHELRYALTRALLIATPAETLECDDAVRDAGTSDLEPSEQDQTPAPAATSGPMTKFDRQKTVARLKGIIR